MSLDLDLISDLSVIMIVAAVVTFIFHKLKQPLILGYLIAGVIIGPYTPPFNLIHRLDVIEATANLGMVLLLFTIGLEFPLARLKQVRLKVYLGITAIEIATMFLVSYLLGKALGWSLTDSLYLGAAIASSSTVIIAKVLAQMGKLKEESSLVMMGVLVCEDLVVILILSAMSSIVGEGGAAITLIMETLIKAVIFLVVVTLIGVFLIPRLIDRISKPDNIFKPEPEVQPEHDEVLILISLGLCFGLSFLGSSLGLSTAIGAFLTGVFIASSRSAARVSHLTSPIKDMFAAIFFVSMGALIDVTEFRVFLVPAVLITVVMIIGKTLGVGIGTRLFGYDLKTSLKIGLSMGQIGEFGLIVVTTGLALGVISNNLFAIIGVAVGLSSFVSPYMIRFGSRIDPDRFPPGVKRFFRVKPSTAANPAPNTDIQL